MLSVYSDWRTAISQAPLIVECDLSPCGEIVHTESQGGCRAMSGGSDSRLLALHIDVVQTQ